MRHTPEKGKQTEESRLGKKMDWLLGGSPWVEIRVGEKRELIRQIEEGTFLDDGRLAFVSQSILLEEPATTRNTLIVMSPPGRNLANGTLEWTHRGNELGIGIAEDTAGLKDVLDEVMRKHGFELDPEYQND